MLLLSLFACADPAFNTSNPQVRVSASDMVDVEAADGGPSPMFAGAVMCPTLACDGDDCDGDWDVGACFTGAMTGAASLDAEGCVSFDSAGAAEWTLTQVDCPAVDAGWAPGDAAVTFDVRAPDTVTGWFEPELEELAEDMVADGSLLGDIPADWTPTPGEPLQIVAGTPVRLEPRLVGADGVAVAWPRTDATVTATVLEGTAPQIDATDPTFPRLTLSGGSKATLSLEVAGATFALGEVDAVPVSAAKSLEVAGFVANDAPDGISTPYAARAIVRDADDRLIFGAPVEWHTGILAISATGADAGLPGPDYVTVADTCRQPTTIVGEQTAVLNATVAGLSDTFTFTWSPPPATADDDAAWTRPDECDTAPFPELRARCGCSTGGEGGGTAMAVGVALVVLARRRRRGPGAVDPCPSRPGM